MVRSVVRVLFLLPFAACLVPWVGAVAVWPALAFYGCAWVIWIYVRSIRDLARIHRETRRSSESFTEGN